MHLHCIGPFAVAYLVCLFQRRSCCSWTPKYWMCLKPQSHYSDNQSPTSDNHFFFFGGCRRLSSTKDDKLPQPPPKKGVVRGRRLVCRYSVTVALHKLHSQHCVVYGILLPLTSDPHHFTFTRVELHSPYIGPVDQFIEIFL